MKRALLNDVVISTGMCRMSVAFHTSGLRHRIFTIASSSPQQARSLCIMPVMYSASHSLQIIVHALVSAHSILQLHRIKLELFF